MIKNARDHEERTLVEGVGDQESREGDHGVVRADADQHDQRPQRHDGGIGQQLLGPGMGNGHESTKEHGHPTEERQQQRPELTVAHGRTQPREQVDPCLNHGGGVEEGGDWCGRRHRIGQPEMEGHLRGLGKTAGKNAEQ